MIVLALDAALGSFSAAIAKDGECLARAEISGNCALEQGLALVSRVMDEAALSPERIDRIGAGIGPGGFTGVRIAISYAKSLAQGWNVPLVGVNSFDAIEAGLPPYLPSLAVVRGRVGVVSVRYRFKSSERRLSGYVKDVADALNGDGSPDETVRACGDTQDVLSALAERGWSVKPTARVILPAALAVASVAGEREPAHTFHEVRADYGELPAARIPNLSRARPETP